MRRPPIGLRDCVIGLFFLRECVKVKKNLCDYVIGYPLGASYELGYELGVMTNEYELE